MLPIKGVYEIAVRVQDLARLESFYKEVLGLKEAATNQSLSDIWLVNLGGFSNDLHLTLECTLQIS